MYLAVTIDNWEELLQKKADDAGSLAQSVLSLLNKVPEAAVSKKAAVYNGAADELTKQGAANGVKFTITVVAEEGEPAHTISPIVTFTLGALLGGATGYALK